MVATRDPQIRSIIIQPGVRWGAAAAGVIVALGAWLLLHALALGIGLTAIDPTDTGSLRGVGIGTGIAAAFAPVIALFLGGLVAGRVAGAMTASGATILGAILWALTTMIAIILMVFALRSMTGVRGVQYHVLAPPPGSDIGGAVTEAREAATPALTPRDGVRPGSPAELRAPRLRQGEPATPRLEPGAPAPDPRLQAALRRAEQAGRAMLSMFFMMLASLAAAIAGALVAARRNLLRDERDHGAVSPTGTARSPRTTDPGLPPPPASPPGGPVTPIDNP